MSTGQGPRLRLRSGAGVARGAALLFGLVVLLAAVAIVAGMARPAGGDVRGFTVSPAALVAWGFAAALAAGLLLSAVGPFWSRREKWVALVVVLALLLGFAILAERAYVRTQVQPLPPQTQTATPPPQVSAVPSQSSLPVRPQPAPPPPATRGTAALPPWVVAIIGSIALLLAVVVLRVGAGRGRGGAAVSPAAAALGDAVEVSIAELEGEADPRRAIVAAWFGMGDALARHGLRRRPDEAAVEYMRRALGAVRVRPESVQRLTALFQRARYSDHPATPAMRDEALDALRRVRDDLQEDSRA